MVESPEDPCRHGTGGIDGGRGHDRRAGGNDGGNDLPPPGDHQFERSQNVVDTTNRGGPVHQ
jgi:hypothetical protein